jgi:uncharacterized protein (UPF0305 family)
MDMYNRELSSRLEEDKVESAASQSAQEMTYPIVLCAANSYYQKFYLDERFAKLPEEIKKELQVLCVLYVEDVGGILTLQINEDEELEFAVTHEEADYLFDEIGSVLKIKQIQAENQELLESLELYYKVFIKQEPFEG